MCIRNSSIGLLPATDFFALDQQLCFYVEHLWETQQSKERATFTLAAVQHFLQCKRKMPSAWHLLTVWGRHEIPCRTPPLPCPALLAMAGAAMTARRSDLCFLLLIGFFGLLRTGELLKLRHDEVLFDDKSSSVLVALPSAKTSTRKAAAESLVVSCPAYRLLRHLHLHLPSDKLIWQGSPFLFRKEFDQLLVFLQLESCNFRPYSLRRGGATHLFQQQTPVENIMVLGRWQHVRTCKIYLQDGVARLTELAFPTSVKTTLAAYSEVLGFL